MKRLALIIITMVVLTVAMCGCASPSGDVTPAPDISTPEKYGAYLISEEKLFRGAVDDASVKCYDIDFTGAFHCANYIEDVYDIYYDVNFTDGASHKVKISVAKVTGANGLSPYQPGAMIAKSFTLDGEAHTC